MVRSSPRRPVRPLDGAQAADCVPWSLPRRVIRGEGWLGGARVEEAGLVEFVAIVALVALSLGFAFTNGFHDPRPTHRPPRANWLLRYAFRLS